MSIAVRPTAAVAVDPATALARLAAGGFGDYVAYERDGVWLFAADPRAELALDRGELRLTAGGRQWRETWTDRPAAALGRGLAQLRAAVADEFAAAYGWVGFEFCAPAAAPAGCRLAQLMIPRLLVRIVDGAAEVAGATAAELDRIAELLAAAAEPLPLAEPVAIADDRDDYRGRVAAALTEIEAGRYHKVILSRRVAVPFPVDLPASYRLGRAHNTPARSFLLRLAGLAAAGFSPELVVAVAADGAVTTEPLAGTRAHGRGADADAAARAELEADPKEIVEHAVSVKSSMSEVATVSVPGTVSVPDFMTVRTRGSVQHLASTVRGELAAGRTAWDALAALFPAVTASGIPKQPAIDAIQRYDEPRGLYSGAVLAVDSDDALEAALVLRAVYQRDGQAWLRAGAGIVGQSRPEREFTETCEKLGSVAPYLVRAR